MTPSQETSEGLSLRGSDLGVDAPPVFQISLGFMILSDRPGASRSSLAEGAAR
jgi:hypothetical protein